LIDFIELGFEVEEAELSFGVAHCEKKVLEKITNAHNVSQFFVLSRSTLDNDGFLEVPVRLRPPRWACHSTHFFVLF
jgi:hypothetical protein